MNFLDIGILIIMALMIIRGFLKGIIQEAAALFGVLVGLLSASFYYKDLAAWLGRYLPDHRILLAIFCFIVLFVIVLFLIRVLAIMTRGAIRLAFLGWLDRTLGGVFGLIKGMIIIVILVTLLMFFSPKTSTLINESRLFPHLLTMTEKLAFLIPHKIKTDFLDKKRELGEYWSGKKKNVKKLEKIKVNE
jgi:membrane protein required for colicin V production